MKEQLTIWINLSWPWVFYGTIILLLSIEQVAPRKKYEYSRISRWIGNVGIYALVKLLFKLFPILAVIGVARISEEHSWGLFNSIAIPYALVFLASFAIFDYSQYLKHRFFHSISVLWNTHRLHHSDPEIDVTTEFKHHPLEALFSAIANAGVILIFGLDIFALLIYIFLLIVISPVSHANIELPAALEKPLRWLIVTPDMHRIHHSSYQPETDSNFGILLSVWDRLFGTHVQSPHLGHENIQLGLDEFRESEDLLLHKMLLQPFVDVEARRAKLEEASTDSQPE